MSADILATPSSADLLAPPATHHRFWTMALGSLGVVYGDIGTSPLYAFREAATRASATGVAPGPEAIYGVLSLILWALMLVVTLKYVLLLLYADNRGEGGILTLTALAQKALGNKFTGLTLAAGLVGAALFYGDAAITPAISVLSAVEGLELEAPGLSHAVVAISIVILIGLFMMQKSGTHRVSALFGPVMLGWMLVLALMGLPHILAYPRILLAANPAYAVSFVWQHKLGALAVLGAVFLAVTGAEALYADLGHFGRKPIQAVWLILVFPCLILNYMGQGALLLTHPESISNPFFLMVPHWGLLPLIILSGLATIIASQAVITGAFSLTSQAIQLGLLPRMRILHTSQAHEGQIFMPKINRLLMFAVLFLVLTFGSSDSLASAYGIAVTGTMITTSLLAFVVIWKDWRRSAPIALVLVAPFVAIESIFLIANLTKLFDGGIVPLLVAAILVLVMAIWVRGSRYLAIYARRKTMPLTALLALLERDMPHRVSGTAIFLTGDAASAPISLVQNLKYNHVLHEKNIILHIVTASIPEVPAAQRASHVMRTPDIMSMTLTYGYMETPDVPAALAAAGLDIPLRDVSYFLSTRKLIADKNRGLPLWQDSIFIGMAKNAVNAAEFYRLPPGRVVELGVQIVI